MGRVGLVVVIVCGCGARVLGDPASGGDSDGDGDGDAVDCSPREGAAEARVVLGEGGIPAIEVHATGFAEPEPLSCADEVDGCDYEIHRLFPLEGLAVGELSVAAGDMLHEVEYCSCCNGEGGPDESEGSYHFEGGTMEIESVGDAWVIGSFVSPGPGRLAFVAERCDR